MPIARHYAGVYSRKYDKPEKQFSAEAEKALVSYDWPGNVRSLRHSIERALILAKNDVLESADLQLDNFAHFSADARSDSTFNLDELEKETVNNALRKHGFNISRAANELGITRTSLYRRMEKHGI